MISLGVRAGRSADLKESSDRIKSWVRQLLSLPNDAVVTVSEITCRDVKCPGVETVILVMPPGAPTRLVKISAPLLDVQLDDIEAALK
ncbi:MAG TPA: nitrate reductase [Methylocystis sp.]|jgi:hypothetical protein